jgi:hypothetical protein
MLTDLTPSGALPLRTCQRCIKGEVSWTDDTAHLIGEVVVTLCNPCRTEFSKAVRASDAWRRRLDLDARKNHYVSLARAGTPVTEAAWVALQRDLDANEMELHAVAVEFVKPIPSPVPAAERDT